MGNPVGPPPRRGQKMAEMIPQMAGQPIKNTKKLLEIFLEVARKNQRKDFPPELLSKLEAWSETKSLRPVIQKIKDTLILPLPASNTK
ncbi:MAG: DUF6493 family protein [Bacteroidota bacterium]